MAAIGFTGLPFFNMAGIHQETLKVFQFSVDNTSPPFIFLKGQAPLSPGVRSTSMTDVTPNTVTELVQGFSIAWKALNFGDTRQNHD